MENLSSKILNLTTLYVPYSIMKNMLNGLTTDDLFEKNTYIVSVEVTVPNDGSEEKYIEHHYFVDEKRQLIELKNAAI